MTKGLIYILDDDAGVRDSLSILLQSYGFKVAAFATADEFLASSTAHAPQCAIVDIRMPGVSGLELLSIMRHRQMAVPVVIITGHGDVQTAVQSMKLGAVDVLQKPFPHDQLLRSIAAAVSREAPRPEASAPAEPEGEMQQRIRSLSPREREILDLIVQGKSSREIAAALTISVATVNNHRTQIKTKMSARTVAHLLAMMNKGVNVA